MTHESAPASAPESGEDFVRRWRAEAARLHAHGLYDPADEHSSCGVGLIAAIDGKPRREVVTAAVQALKRVWHRGALDADGKTGDGAGLYVQIPQAFFKQHIRATGHEPDPDEDIAVGMIFLPRTDLDAQERCRAIVETEILHSGFRIYGWRQVPADISIIGEKAAATRPEIEQIMVANALGLEAEAFERELFIIRRRIENRVRASVIRDFYVCSLSCRSVVYKGMFLAEQLSEFYPDLTDERFESAFAVYHQRYSTNTFPAWELAQPFRMLAHNGEINTLRGNVNWAAAHEPKMASGLIGAAVEDIKPVIREGSSDSAALDAVFELLVRAGRPAPMAKALMIPESVGQNKTIPENHAALFAYCYSVMEPWDGPAAICAADGRWAVAGMDRNGLRPLRYMLTRDGLLIVGSETGMTDTAEADIIEKGRVGPGGVIGVDLHEGVFYRDRDMKDWLAARNPYGAWVAAGVKSLDDVIESSPAEKPLFDGENLRRRQCGFGLSMEDMELILQPMAQGAGEATGSMGDDAPLAVLSDQYRGLHHFFRQTFSQVTNPPIDSLRERAVMSLRTRLGNLGNVLAEEPSQCDLLQLESPVVNTASFEALLRHLGPSAAVIDCTFEAAGGDGALHRALDRIRDEAEDAVRGGCTHLVLSDMNTSPERAPAPMILAAGGVHTHLVRQSLRTYTSINIRSGECLDVHYFAVLIGVGATAINAYLAEETIRERRRRGLLGDLSLEQCIANFTQSVDKGLLKIMSKMGIGVISSYRGGYCFEAAGLSRSLVAAFFPGMPSRISGIGLQGIQEKVLAAHAKAWSGPAAVLPVGGFYRWRSGAERHGHDGKLIHMLQAAVGTESYQLYKRYAEGVYGLEPVYLRDLLDFKTARKPLAAKDVQSITEIRKRLVAPGISLGALSPEAHETLSIAMNRIGAKSDSGEGGEDPARYKPRANGDNASSAIKQVASGRFGVTAEYLNNCREIEIKIAQGAKPGEGGQLPGFKVSPEIARLRHATPGVSLISPPPHHDIYSIEDLAQLIYDLKQINPDARVCVKLVSRTGVGAIAAGVAKAKADVILISGHDGGTGASPQSSIKYAGMPWEMGLAEAHQVLTLNRLRQNVTLRVDGGIKTGRDVVIAAMLGADEYGVGTASLVAMGCIMVRQCHSNTCPVGVCTQNPALREKFTGTPEKVVNLFTFIAEEVSEILAGLGFESMDAVTGRADLLHQVSRGAESLDDLDMNALLQRADSAGAPARGPLEGRNEVPDSLDAQILRDAGPLLAHGEKMQLTYTVRNTHRAVGARAASAITRRYGMAALDPGHLTVRLRGSAGQSLGAFAVQGMTLEVLGDANDYVGKGLSGGIIVLRPPVSSPLESQDNVIIGNTVLYGATAGQLFAAGQAGERFAVRNSGADAVIEGCGSNGCEYMTGGTCVILGPVGHNFGAGMTGGMAFVLGADSDSDAAGADGAGGGFMDRLNGDTVIAQRIQTDYWAEAARRLINLHVRKTKSRHGLAILNDWGRMAGRFWQIVPKEMLDKMEHPLSPADGAEPRTGAAASGDAAE